MGHSHLGHQQQRCAVLPPLHAASPIERYLTQDPASALLQHRIHPGGLPLATSILPLS